MAHRRPSFEVMESRLLLTATSTYAARAAQVRREAHTFESELQRLELESRATPAQYLALRDDARSLSDAASSTTLPPGVANEKALAVSLQLDRAALDGWASESDWAVIEGRLAGNLEGLNAPQALIDRTIADMKSLARSAGVTADEYQTFTDDTNDLRNGESSLPSGYGHYPDPGIYYTQHLRGFFRGGAAQRASDQKTLNADVSALPPAARALARRDAGLLEKVGADLTSGADRQFNADYLGAFPPEAAAIKATLLADLGAGAPPSAALAVDRLLGDAPAFVQAVGGSMDHVRTIVADAQALVADGGGAALNPFKVEIVRQGLR